MLQSIFNAQGPGSRFGSLWMSDYVRKSTGFKCASKKNDKKYSDVVIALYKYDMDSSVSIEQFLR